jgi:carbon-monoxide dehydrogenase large subunit
MALDKDGRILAVRDKFSTMPGAYAPYGLTVPLNSQCTLLGCYDIQNYYSEFTSVFTNKPSSPPTAARGGSTACLSWNVCSTSPPKNWGNIDKAEIRRRNFIPPDQFPYNNEIIYQDFAPLRPTTAATTNPPSTRRWP